jgi:hypothetical protein
MAQIRLLTTGESELGRLDIEYSRLMHLRHSTTRPLEFLVLAASVYALDKLVARATAPDGWTREFSLVLPVAEPGIWRKAQAELNACLSFLSGDVWQIQFTKSSEPLAHSVQPRKPLRPTKVDAACLLSGGLDSLVGLIDRLESHPQERFLAIGHHDGSGPKSDQQRLLGRLRPRYPERIDPVLVRVGHSPSAVEITLRSRSILFLALGIFGAASIGPDAPLLIPENGTISLNIPLTPSRRGSCSTRTTHPYVLQGIQSILAILDIRNPILNPLAMKTKGEAVLSCLNQEVLRGTALDSVSCAKRGHKREWADRSAKACGRCMPCVYRRAALHRIGLDTERYGNDVCTKMAVADGGADQGDADFRACVSFVRQNLPASRLQSILMASGHLDVRKLAEYADIVVRTRDEIRAFLRDKAKQQVRAAAGLA